MKRFWSKVHKLPGDDSCWLWTAGKDRYGYGQFKLDGKVMRAHQVSWKIQKGEFCSYLCHTCDNRACVNPAHLYQGSPVSNVADKIDRGRSNYPAKYNEETVIAIRQAYSDGLSSNQIVDQFAIPKSTVLNILNGKLYKSMGGPIRDRNRRYFGNRFKRAISQKS